MMLVKRHEWSRLVYKSWKMDFGFTLVEILVVLAIVGMISVVVYPRMGYLSRDSIIKKSARRFSGLVRYLRGLSATENRIHKLYLDLDQGKCWVVYIDEKGMEKLLTDDVVLDGITGNKLPITEVRTPGKLVVRDGQTSILFFGTGEVEGSEILYSYDDEKILHLKIHPLTGHCSVWWEEKGM